MSYAVPATAGALTIPGAEFPPKLTPQPGPQTEFLSSPADIAIYGGSAGSGKSYALLLEPLRHATNRDGFAAVTFRRTTPELRAPGGLFDWASRIYGEWRNVRSRSQEMEWIWEQGGKAKLAGLELEKDVLNWHGAQIPLIQFDELTTFTQHQFFYLVSRNRSTCGVDPYIRATCNPDADSWVAKFIEWWIDEEGFPIPERSGVLRWFIRVKDEIRWANTKEELHPSLHGLPTHMMDADGNDVPLDYRPLSVTFIPAKIFDNKELLRADPSYLAKLLALPEVERARLLDGNWKIRPAAGLLFQRGWCQIVETVPGTIMSYKRGWDLAATRKTTDNDPDKSASTGIAKLDNGLFLVMDHAAMWGDPYEVDEEVKRKAVHDIVMLDGPNKIEYSFPQDPGQAGKSQKKPIHENLDGFGFTVSFSPETGDKVVRFSAFSAAAKAGRVLILKGAWNEAFFLALEGFPDGRYKDPADATGRAYNAFHESPAGLIEFYQQQALQMTQQGLADHKVQAVTLEEGGILMAPPSPVTQLYDAQGRLLLPNAKGQFIVSQKQALGLRVSGWRDV